MTSHAIAIQTYGKQRLRGQASGAMLTAYNLGYTSAARALLLALFAGKAVDVTPPQASYHYVSLDGNPSLTQNYLLLRLTDAELAQAEAVTRRHTGRAGVWCWRDDQWQALPTATQTAYQPDVSLRLTPTAARLHTLSAEAAPAGIQIERVQRSPNEAAWWWVSGETYPHRAALKTAGGRWSKQRAAWYFIGALPASVQALAAPVAAPEVPPPSVPSRTGQFQVGQGVQAAQTFTALGAHACEVEIGAGRRGTVTRADGEVGSLGGSYHVDFGDVGEVWCFERDLAPVETPPPAVRVPVEGAQVARVSGAPVTRSADGTQRIAQAFVGELTGSITGQVYCYGYATHQGVLWYLNLAGPRTAVEAIRAKLAKGEVVSLTPWDAPALELSAGEDADGKAQTGMFSAYLQHLPEAKFTQAILVHEALTQPNYGGKSATGILRTDEAQARAKLLGHVRALVGVAVFDDWADFLYQAGQAAGLVRRAPSGGGIDVLAVTLDVDDWERLISGGLAKGTLALPVNA